MADPVIEKLVEDVRLLEDVGVIEMREDAPSDTDDDEFCHIVDAGGKYYCGKPRSRGAKTTCKRYEGEAICPSCGRATCPTCAVRSDLAVRLEGT